MLISLKGFEGEFNGELEDGPAQPCFFLSGFLKSHGIYNSMPCETIEVKEDILCTFGTVSHLQRCDSISYMTYLCLY